MANIDGSKSGGRKKGSLNKKSILKREALEQAQKEIASADGSGMFDGDMYALLTTVARCEKFPIELRVDCAKAAIGYERPRLEAVDSTIRAGGNYIVHMPAPALSLEEWRKTADNEPQDDGAFEAKMLEWSKAAKPDDEPN